MLDPAVFSGGIRAWLDPSRLEYAGAVYHVRVRTAIGNDWVARTT